MKQSSTTLKPAILWRGIFADVYAGTSWLRCDNGSTLRLRGQQQLSAACQILAGYLRAGTSAGAVEGEHLGARYNCDGIILHRGTAQVRLERAIANDLQIWLAHQTGAIAETVFWCDQELRDQHWDAADCIDLRPHGDGGLLLSLGAQSGATLVTLLSPAAADKLGRLFAAACGDCRRSWHEYVLVNDGYLSLFFERNGSTHFQLICQLPKREPLRLQLARSTLAHLACWRSR